MHVWPVHRPVVQPGHFASSQTCLVCTQLITHERFLTLSLGRPRRLPCAFSYVLAVNVLALFHSWRDHGLRTLKVKRFDNSLRVSLSGLYAIPSS